MQVVINGTSHKLPDKTTIAILVRQFCKDPDRVVVELNGKIVTKDAWPSTSLKSGDRMELVTFVGGG